MSQVEVSGRAADGGPRQHRHSTHRRRRGHAPLRTAVADAVGRSGSGESQTWHESVQHAAAQHLRGGPAGRCRGAAPTLRNGGGVLGEASYSKCGAVHQRESTVAAATVVVAAGAPLLVTTPTSAAAAAAAFAYLPTATAVRRVAARSRRGRLSSPALPLPSGILSSAVPLHGLRQWRSFETPGLQQLRSFEKPGLLRVLRVRKHGPKNAADAALRTLPADREGPCLRGGCMPACTCCVHWPNAATSREYAAAAAKQPHATRARAHTHTHTGPARSGGARSASIRTKTSSPGPSRSRLARSPPSLAAAASCAAAHRCTVAPPPTPLPLGGRGRSGSETSRGSRPRAASPARLHRHRAESSAAVLYSSLPLPLSQPPSPSPPPVAA